MDNLAQQVNEAVEKALRARDEQERLDKLLKENTQGVPSSFVKRYNLEREEDLRDVAAKVREDYAALVDEMRQAGEIVERKPEDGEKETLNFLNNMGRNK